MSTKQGKGAYGTALCERKTRYDLDDALVLEGGAHRISEAAQHKSAFLPKLGYTKDRKFLTAISSCGKMLRAENIKNYTAPPQVFLVILAVSINDK